LNTYIGANFWQNPTLGLKMDDIYVVKQTGLKTCAALSDTPHRLSRQSLPYMANHDLRRMEDVTPAIATPPFAGMGCPAPVTVRRVKQKKPVFFLPGVRLV
jgi:hypothetical protein